MFSKAVALSVLAAVASAQQSIYGQCGGQGFSGPLTCSAGLACNHINDYYWQCLSATGAVSTTLATTTRPASTTTTKPITTSPAPTTKATTTTTKGTTTTPKVGTTSTAPPTTTSASSGGSAGNIFAGKQIYANPYYSSEVINIAIPSLTDAALKAKASKVANIGSFTWLDTLAKVPTMDTYLADIQKKNAAGASPPIVGAFVVYDLPDRDCAALASNGEYSIANNGLANYKNYIDAIAVILKKYPTVPVALIIEPDSLGNLVTNLNVPKCAGAEAAYKAGITYAVQQLNVPNVSSYLDAGHAGWLGWAANLGPAAQLFGSIYKAAGSPSQLRGLATNVANYNAFSIATCPAITQGNVNCDEQRYINALAPLLTAQGFPAHFVVDTSRDGVQPTKQLAWGDWCNVIGTGFGARPTTNTGDPLVDAFLWIKPGGEGDGTSDTSSARYDSHCGLADALQPAPEAGTWFQAYFTQLLTNANPAI